MNSNYDFIMQGGGNKPARGPALPSNDSTAKRLIMVGGGAVVLLFIFILVVAMLSGGGGGNERLLAIVQRQHSLANAAELTLKDADNQNLKNFAITAQLGAQSDQKELIEFARQVGIGFKEDEVGLGVKPSLQSDLETAKAAGLFQQTALEALDTELQAYMAALSTGYQETVNEELRELLASQYEAAELLAVQLAAVQP